MTFVVYVIASEGARAHVLCHGSINQNDVVYISGLIPHSNHAAAAVMIVNPTTPNAVTGNISQPFNVCAFSFEFLSNKKKQYINKSKIPFQAPNQNRNNLSRNLNPARNNFDNNSIASNNNTTPPTSNSRSGTKTVNLMNNMYDQGQGSFNNINESNSVSNVNIKMTDQ